MISQNNLILKDLIWLLEIYWAGSYYRFSSESISITNTFIDGSTSIINFQGGLSQIDFSRSLSLFSVEPNRYSTAIEVVFPIDVAQQIQYGHDLAEADCELSLMAIDDDYSNRDILLKGRVIDPEYGALDEPVTFSIESNLYETDIYIPQSSLVINKNTFDTLHLEHDDAEGDDTSVIGSVYPIVFGTPGNYRNITGGHSVGRGTPAYLVWKQETTEDSKILLAGHHCYPDGGTIYILNTSAGNSDTAVIENGYDDLNQEICTTNLLLDASAAYSSCTPEHGATYWVSWGFDQNDFTPAGGISNKKHINYMSKAGEVLEYLLDQTGLEVDKPRFYTIMDYLNQYEISGYISERVKPLEWITDNLLPILPVSITVGTDGIYPILWQSDVPSNSVQTLLTNGQGCQRTSNVRYDRSNLANDIKLSFALNGESNEYLRYLKITADEQVDVMVDRRIEYANTYVKISQNRYGKKSKEITTDIVFEDTTAGLILSWMSKAFSFPTKTVSYSVDKKYLYLNIGDIVLLTDDELHITEKPCYVKRIKYDLISPDIELLIFEDPIRDSRI